MRKHRVQVVQDVQSVISASTPFAFVSSIALHIYWKNPSSVMPAAISSRLSATSRNTSKYILVETTLSASFVKRLFKEQL